eukprot:PhM_4_TR13969/c0_g1_i3/m.91848/K09456/aidB; putative acyl-CoA dehydrogenase
MLRRNFLLRSVSSHKVFNQSVPLEGYNAYTSNPRVRDAVATYGAGWADAHLTAHGAALGTSEAHRLARLANEYPPTFRPFDPYGHRVNGAEYHDAYHGLMRLGLAEGKVASYAWENEGKPGAHVARGALMYMQYQLESGTCCPMVMTFACVPALSVEPTQRNYKEWVAKAASGGYDNRDLPIEAKKAVTLGMSMTEKQGGSDVRANTTVATQRNDGSWSLVGHKWFTSAPMSDGFLTLAQTGDSGLSCFLVPRWYNGERNDGLMFQRLKPKVGDRSNASSEVEYHGAIGTLIGPVGKGVKTIVQMVNHT